MAEERRELRFEQQVKAEPKGVYYAFSTAQGWRDWLCDSARFEAQAEGTYQLSWNNGWFAAGTVQALDKPGRVELTWRGMDDSGFSTVLVSLTPKDSGTLVELVHRGFGQGEGWDHSREEVAKGWEIGLENLASIFDTGEDLRITRRPMLGIMLDDYNSRVAAELGVPVKEGVRISRPIEGMGAEAAGLKPNDVVVGMAGTEVANLADLGVALQGRQAGDVVPVTVYRGPEKISVDMELSSRPQAEVPMDPAAFAERLRELDRELLAELREALEGVDDEAAAVRPAPTEWSIKEVLAHLVLGEHYNMLRISELIADSEREFFPADEEAYHQLDIKALAEVTPTVSELVQQLERGRGAIVEMLSQADKLNHRKGVLWRLGQEMLAFPGAHERGHIDQIKATAAAVQA